MICVSVGRGRHKQLALDHQRAAEMGAKIVELRLDMLIRTVDLPRILPERPTPVVVTVRRPADGGRWHGSEADRLMLLRNAIVAGVEYVDLELDIAGAIPRYGKTKRIVSYHNFQETPANLAELHRQLASKDADVVKIATMANSATDALRVMQIARDSKVPTIAICMGEYGTATRILAGKWGAPFTFAAIDEEKALAPGQLDFRTLSRRYRYEKIQRSTQVYAVIGDPIVQSKSPVVHNAAFDVTGLDAVYVPFRVGRDELFDFFGECEDLDIRGLSVTIPHKERTVAYAQDATESVKSIGAANTLVFKGGRAAAFNTDYRAAMQCLSASGEDLAGDALAGKTALLIGSGGVSRALAYGLKAAGARVLVTSRTAANAEAFAKDLKVEVVRWEERLGMRPDILVNGTPVGMFPNVDESPWNEESLEPEMTVFDTIYNPEQTLLVKHARARGCRVVTGVDMFIRQAAIQFKRFTDKTAPVETMHRAFKRALSPVRYDEDY